MFYCCVGLTNITVPQGVTRIGEASFFHCDRLINATFQGNVASIGDWAFGYCGSLTSLYLGGNAPTVGGAVFEGTPQALIVYYRPGTTGWGYGLGGRLAVRLPPVAPAIDNQLDLGVVLEGTTTRLRAGISGLPWPSFQWFFNGQPVGDATNETWVIESISSLEAGTYQVVASNELGRVTNGPVTLGVNNIAASNFIGLELFGSTGTAVQVQSAAQLDGPWTPQAELAPTSNPAVFIDFSATNPVQRFYRTTAPGGLAVWMLPGWNYAAPAGSQHKIEFVNAQVGFTRWQFLTNLTLPSSPFLFIDTSATEKSQRYYRTTPLP